ncbi:MAG: DsbA family protein [Methyloprofundus sp.]|nr:DsbA family protein [Methyloprofundus sp.]
MHTENNTLYYIYDPMCSWCYAFEASLNEIQKNLPHLISFKGILGGLAPDSTQAMPAETKAMVQRAWHQIEHTVPNIQFNFDFWSKNTPYRSTYPACRAIIAATLQGEGYSNAMRKAIQQAYYQDAKNPSLSSTLLQCAEFIELDAEQFTADYSSNEVNSKLLEHINFSRSLAVNSYPSLRLVLNNKVHIVPINYTQAAPSLQKIQQLLHDNKTQPIASPCLKECRLNSQDMCSSCFRSLVEITNWPTMTEHEKQQCIDKCAQRKSSQQP